MNFESLIPISDTEEFVKFQENFLTKPKVVLVIGKRRTGKTSFALRLIENKSAKNTEMQIYSYKFPAVLPSPIKRITDVGSVKSNSELFVDEIGMFFSSKRHMEEEHLTLADVLFLAGQKNLTLIATSQYAISTDLNVLRNADILAIKEMSLFQIQTERPILKQILKNVKECFDFIPEKERNSYTYIMSDEFRGLVKFTPPSFWNENISYAFKDMKIK